MPYYYLSGSLYNDDNLHYSEEATNYIINVISNLLCGSSYIPSLTVNIEKSAFEGWNGSGALQVSATNGKLSVSTPYLLLSKSTEEPFATDQYNNTILLKSRPISATDRTVFPLLPTRLYVQLKINGTIYTDILECTLDNQTHQLIWTTDNKYPATNNIIIKIMSLN